MASTRAIGRALRKYTNIDMLCTEELDESDMSIESMSELASEQMIDQNQMVQMKGIITQKNIDKNTFETMLVKTFNVQDFQQLTYSQAETMINILNNYIAPSK
jgi:N12 class adenine-specific DNA methylase